MKKRIILCLFLATSVLLLSCQKDEKVPLTDYSIESGSNFELISQHSNGWIKEARYNNYHLGGYVPKDEFEYYENGNIKTAKVYSLYPQQHLYMEISRSEDNKPLWSKYYTPEGDLWFETDYLNGLPSVKTVYSDKGKAEHNYTNGELISVVFTTNDGNGSSTTSFNRTVGTKKLTIIQNGITVLEEEYPYLENYGEGVLTTNQAPLANPFVNAKGAYIKIEESFFNSPIWEFNADPIEYMLPFRNYYEFYNASNKFATKFGVNSEIYQTIIEQYPVTEDEVLMVRYKYDEGIGTFIPSFEERDSLNNIMKQDSLLFELKYGNEYVEKMHYGKNLIIIGALRNMPTSETASNEIKEIAQKQMNAIINGNIQLSTEEQQILAKVWFEVKLFSTVKELLNGVVLHSTDDYNAALEDVLNAESSIIQLEYIPFSHMISN